MLTNNQICFTVVVSQHFIHLFVSVEVEFAAGGLGLLKEVGGDGLHVVLGDRLRQLLDVAGYWMPVLITVVLLLKGSEVQEHTLLLSG